MLTWPRSFLTAGPHSINRRSWLPTDTLCRKPRFRPSSPTFGWFPILRTELLALSTDRSKYSRGTFIGYIRMRDFQRDIANRLISTRTLLGVLSVSEVARRHPW